MENFSIDQNYKYIAKTPYRVCLLGAHIDHQLGIVTGFALNRNVNFSYNPLKTKKINIYSRQFKDSKEWFLNNIPEKKQFDWADHLRGASLELSKKYVLNFGLEGVFDGELPIGGLSSSASVILAFLKALAFINNIELSNKELIDFVQRAENNYVGVKSGKLDPSCEVLCKKDTMLYLDTLLNEYNLISCPKTNLKYKFGIFFSGLDRSLAASDYNLRTDECKKAAQLLAEYGNLHLDLNDIRLRDIPYEIFIKYGNKLDEKLKKRATHYYEEMNRVKTGILYWNNGDIISFGKLITESGLSSVNNYEVGSKELTELFNIIKKQKGVYGARFSGAGFKGCCVALIDPSFEKEIQAGVESEYLKTFPELTDKYAFFMCESADGIGK